MSVGSENGQSDKAAKEARQHADALASKAGDEASRVARTAADAGKQRAEQQFERGKGVAEGHVQAVQSAVDDAAQRLEDEDHPFASYATELSGQLSSLSQRIESSSLDELVRDGRGVARSNPGLFMLGAVAVGFAASRFLKASERHDESDYVQPSSFDEDEDEVHERYLSQTSAAATPYRRSVQPPIKPVPSESRTVSATAPSSAGSSAGSTPSISRPSPTNI